MRNKITSFLIGCLAALLISCGGGGVIGLLVEGGIGGTGISFGPIALLGSATVNSTKFEFDNNTEILVDGLASTQDDLKVGFVVRVEGDFDNLTASKVEYEETVRGQVESIDPNINLDNSAATFTVMGQTVKTNSLTVFDNLVLDPLDPEALKIDDVIDVSGIRDENDDIVASYIERKTDLADLDEYRVTGVVDTVDPLTDSFTIEDLTVDASTLSTPLPDVGDLVRVKGDSADFTSPPSAIVASEVTLGLSPMPVNGQALEIEGFIDQFTDVSDFQVNGIRVDASAAIFEGGTSADLALGVRIEVEGDVDVNGVVQALDVEIKPDNSISIAATVSGVSNINSTLSVLGGEVEIRITESTLMTDKRSPEVPLFDLSDIQPGDYIEVRGFVEAGSNTVIATKLEREEDDPDEHLQAPAQDPIIGDVQLLGVAIFTDAQTEYEDEFDGPLTEAAFFLDLNLGDLVKAKWKDFNGTTFTPIDELSLESEE